VTDPVTPDPFDLDQIKARRAAITPTPWGWADSETDEELDATDVASGEHSVYLHGAEWGDDLERGSVVLPTDWRFVAHGVEEIERADAEFIAHAPTDIDQLVGEVERLRGLLGDPADGTSVVHFHGHPWHKHPGGHWPHVHEGGELNDRVWSGRKLF
jgi:hypothetical protein